MNVSEKGSIAVQIRTYIQGLEREVEGHRSEMGKLKEEIRRSRKALKAMNSDQEEDRHGQS